MEKVAVTLEHDGSRLLAREFVVGSDLEIESLDGHVPGLFVKVENVGLEHEIPPSGVNIQVSIEFTGHPEPVIFYGQWVDGARSRTRHNLPVAILPTTSSVGPYMFTELRFVVDTQNDTFILSDARKADLSGIAAGFLSEQVLLRAQILSITGHSFDASEDEQVIVALGLGSDGRCTWPLQATNEEMRWDEEFTFLLSTESCQKDLPNLEVKLLTTKGDTIAQSSVEIRTLEPLVELNMQVPLDPCGTANLVLEITALLKRTPQEQTNDGKATEEVCPRRRVVTSKQKGFRKKDVPKSIKIRGTTQNRPNNGRMAFVW